MTRTNKNFNSARFDLDVVSKKLSEISSYIDKNHSSLSYTELLQIMLDSQTLLNNIAFIQQKTTILLNGKIIAYNI
jgi:hypothetical protein